MRHVAPERAELIHLEVQRSEDRIRVEVVDHGIGFVPEPRADVENRASGWGLNIVAKVATRWGVENDGGARVWFENDAPLTDAGRADQGQGAIA